MTVVGPVCHIAPVAPDQPNTSPDAIPAIPPATPDIQSILRTVNALRQAMNVLTGKQSGTDGQNGFTPQINGFVSSSNNKVQWTEQSRKMEKVKVYQNNDPSTGNFVEVERINQLVMVNKATGQTWSWDRKRK